MNQATITKVLNKVDEQPDEYLIGFRRWSSLPNRVRINIGVACVLRGESNTNVII